MRFLQTALLVLIGITVANAWIFGGGSSNRSRCVSGGGTGLTKLYNTCVVRAQRYKRPLLTSARRILAAIGIYHQGVVVTLDNGERWLVHKGDEYGNSSETVVVSTSAMSSAWFSSGYSKTVRYSNVGDYVAAGGPNYNLITDNCINGANRMMKLD